MIELLFFMVIWVQIGGDDINPIYKTVDLIITDKDIGDQRCGWYSPMFNEIWIVEECMIPVFGYGGKCQNALWHEILHVKGFDHVEMARSGWCH